MDVDIDLLKKVWRKAKSKAGNRYSALYNIDLEISKDVQAPLQDEFSTNIFKKLQEEIIDKFQKVDWVWVKDKSDDEEFETKIKSFFDSIKKDLTKLERKGLNKPTKYSFEKTRRSLSAMVDYLKPVSEIIQHIDNEYGEQKQKKQEYENFLFKHYDIERTLSNYFAEMLNNPFVYLTGRAGTGKTHLLCSIVEERLNSNLPAIIFLGQEFQAIGSNPWENLIKNIDPGLTTTDFLDGLERLGEENSTRALICIDALNEGDIGGWKKAIDTLCEKVRPYKHIAIVLSFRSEYLSFIHDKLKDNKFREVFHVGFPPDKQLEAIKKYFSHYNIPLPNFPILDSEFSNPLFLRLFCETVEKVDIQKKHNHLKEIASGQSGMTKVLEDFIREKGKNINSKIGINSSTVWKSVKEGLAPEMARQKKPYLSANTTKKILKAYQPINMTGNQLLQVLIEEDILSKDIVHKNNKIYKVIRFTYNRFSDHIIARHIYKNLGSQESIKQSLRDKNGLGAYFKRRKKTADFGVQAALLTEFPKRTGNQKELFDYLGWKTFPIELCKSFIDSLYWRDAEGINKQTIKWINGFLRHDSLRKEVFELCVTLSVKPKNPIGRFFWGYLEDLGLAERDLTWTEYLRHQDEDGVTNRITSWLDAIDGNKYSIDFAVSYLRTLQWFLTSTKIEFRDLATKKIYLIGIQRPGTLFSLTKKSLSFNDPYVTMRMLGASYGVATSVYTEKGKLKKRHLEKFGREIFDLVFSDQAPYKQININIKEFALGIIQVALRINPSLLSAVEKSKIIKPHKEDPKFKWHQSFDIDRNKLQPGQSPLHMDFENYTIGNLVPERHNYDYSNKDYLRIRRQILWRIYNLGYDYNKFEKIDKNISQSDFYRHTENVGKIERYGKKYSWVAFYEMAGYLENRGLLSAYRWRLSDSDVDPSFPEQPNIGSIYNSLNIPDVPLEDFILGDYVPVIEGGFSKRTLANTLGPWIIIDGLIDRIKDDKKIFIFIRGFFVKKKDFHKTIEFLKDITYPGNNKLPESITQHETFAGEIPWSEHWVEYDKDSKKLQINGSTTSVILASSNYNHPGNSANINVFTSFPSVSKELARNLKLESGYPTVDTFELNGKRATVLVSTGEIYRNHESLLYLRKDLLEKFLQENDLRFLLYSWGERNYNPFIERVERRIHNSRFDNIENILHKQGHYYENDEFIKFL